MSDTYRMTSAARAFGGFPKVREKEEEEDEDSDEDVSPSVGESSSGSTCRSASRKAHKLYDKYV